MNRPFQFMVLAFAFLTAPLWTGLRFFKWDAADFFYPYFFLLGQYARQGHLLWWNPYISGGSPDFAEPQVAALSPLTLGFAWIANGHQIGFTLYVLCLWLLGGVGTYWLCRILHAPRWGAAAAGLSLQFSGVYLGHLEHTSHIYTLAFLPWILGNFEMHMASGRMTSKFLVRAALLWGVSGLAGYPALFMLNGCYLFGWSLCRARMYNFSLLKRVGWSMVSVLIIGLLIVAPIYIGFFNEGRGFSDRTGGLDRSTAVEMDALTPLSLPSLFSNMLIQVGDRSAWIDNDISGRSLAIGFSACVLLSYFFLISRRARSWQLSLMALALFFLIAAMGRHLPLRGWLYDFFFPFRYFRHANIFRDYFVITLIVLSSVASRFLHLDLLLNMKATQRLKSAVLLFIGAFLLSLVTFAWLLPIQTIAEASALVPACILGLLLPIVLLSALSKPRFHISSVLLWLCAGQALVHLATSKTVWTDESYSSEAIPSGQIGNEILPEIRYFGSGHNRQFFHGIGALVGYSPFYNRYHLDLSSSNALRDWYEQQQILFSASPLKGPEADSFQNFVGPSREKIGSQLMDFEEKLTKISSEQTSTRLKFSVNAPREGYVLLPIRWAQGWTATVNGRSLAPMVANFIFQAIPVSQGLNVIQIDYQPKFVKIALCISWLLVFSGLFFLFRPLSHFRFSNPRSWLSWPLTFDNMRVVGFVISIVALASVIGLVLIFKSEPLRVSLLRSALRSGRSSVQLVDAKSQFLNSYSAAQIAYTSDSFFISAQGVDATIDFGSSLKRMHLVYSQLQIADLSIETKNPICRLADHNTQGIMAKARELPILLTGTDVSQIFISNMRIQLKCQNFSFEVKSLEGFLKNGQLHIQSADKTQHLQASHHQKSWQDQTSLSFKFLHSFFEAQWRSNASIEYGPYGTGQTKIDRPYADPPIKLSFEFSPNALKVLETNRDPASLPFLGWSWDGSTTFYSAQ